MAKFFFVNDGVDASGIFGSLEPRCISEKEVERLSCEWGENLFEQMHEAAEQEKELYGVYDD